ncbi:Unknown protein sequence [Pseudomonas amygdali pv. myricae]|nr:Unknown protein sequence [Pseudomonas amygdali pv. myricae]
MGKLAAVKDSAGLELFAQNVKDSFSNRFDFLDLPSHSPMEPGG